MVMLRQEELDDLRAERGEQAVRDHYAAEERNVFGHDFKRDKDGKPIEQGIGSVSQPSDNSVRAYERYGKEEPQYAVTLAKLKADLAAYQSKRRGG